MDNEQNKNESQPIPESIETEHLLLKTISLEYKEDIFKEFTPEITVYMKPKPSETLQEVVDFIESSMKSNSEGSNFQIVIIPVGDFLAALPR
jgi:[ribosomal protein S5]-alanine N-acetyltransferase